MRSASFAYQFNLVTKSDREPTRFSPGGCQSLSKVVRLQERSKNINEASESIAKKLSNLGWRLTLY